MRSPRFWNILGWLRYPLPGMGRKNYRSCVQNTAINFGRLMENDIATITQATSGMVLITLKDNRTLLVSEKTVTHRFGKTFVQLKLNNSRN